MLSHALADAIRVLAFVLVYLDRGARVTQTCRQLPRSGRDVGERILSTEIDGDGAQQPAIFGREMLDPAVSRGHVDEQRRWPGLDGVGGRGGDSRAIDELGFREIRAVVDRCARSGGKILDDLVFDAARREGVDGPE